MHRLPELKQHQIGDIHHRLIERSPARRRRSCNHAGVARVLSTPRITRLQSARNPAPSAQVDRKCGRAVAATGGTSGARSALPARAASSRATPNTDIASPRFGVIAISSTESSSSM